jgi:hypothetical protein
MLATRTATTALVMLGTILPSIARGEGQSPPVMAVFLIENRGTPLSDSDMVVLTDYLGTRLGEGGLYLIVPREEIGKRLSEQKRASHKACYDQTCQIEIGRELAAQYTVSAGISRVGTRCIITAAIYDLKKAATFKTASGKASCQQDALVSAVDQVAAKLRGGAEAVTEPAPTVPPRKLKTKSVWVAGVLSLVPGGGMFYVGKWGYGILYACLIVGGIGASFQPDNQDQQIALWVVAGSAFVGSVIHAMFAAADYQEEEEVALDRGNAYARPPIWSLDPAPAFLVPLISGRF